MKQILLVEDEPMLLSAMMEVDWASIGVDHVYTAGSGIEAVNLLAGNSIDVVITDIRMPGMSGLEVCEYVREHCPRTRCIIVSGYSDFPYAQQAIRSKAVNYLIKPVKDAELIAAVQSTLDAIAEEWEAVSSTERARQTLRQNLPLLRSNLLNELITGKYDAHMIVEKLQAYELPFAPGEEVHMFMIRLDAWYRESNDHDQSLYAFSVVNIIEELMQDYFELWSCRDTLGYLVWLIRSKKPDNDSDALLHKLAKQAQGFINDYLKGEASIVLSFRERLYKKEMASVYRHLLYQFRKLPRSDHGFHIRLEEGMHRQHVVSLHQLYQPPTLNQLLEAGRFDRAREKIRSVFEEMQMKRLDDEEHIMEVATAFYNAFAHMAHLQGISIVDLIGVEFGSEIDDLMFKGGAAPIEERFQSMLVRLETLVFQETSDAHAHLAQKVHQYIEDHIAVDISLQAIGDYVHLHPSYLSGMYKQLTGENISDYIYRHRMEKSGFLLRSTDIKIYELARQLGFQNAPYFSKLFKTHYGMTPQEYRERFRAGR